MTGSTLNQKSISPPDFWEKRLTVNATEAIYYQWEQLEQTGCIDNFRITAGIKTGFREGFFFADSDAFKWLDAASWILTDFPGSRLKEIVDSFIEILKKAQMQDGYLYTYNQVHFPGKRWVNLQIEHELYCLGHLIEAGISHQQATGEDALIAIAKKAADLLVNDFMDASPFYTDGHEEIEIALLRLSRHTGNPTYHELAKRLIERRGKIQCYGFHFLAQSLSTFARMNRVKRLRKVYFQKNPGVEPCHLAGHNQHLVPLLTPLRFLSNVLSGKYNQQRAPLQEQELPEGHSVRFAYLNTAAAMLARDEGDSSSIHCLSKLWENMVARRMYVTGGIGSLPLIEGFGRDYELDPEVAYAETCAALGSMLWNREMSLLSKNPRYEDLYEWQLYNASSVSMGHDGKTYFYNNPLVCRREFKRADWYDIPCCPSNLSRVWASIKESALTIDESVIYINQYISGEYVIDADAKLQVRSGLPWNGEVTLVLKCNRSRRFDLRIRVPAWAGKCQVLFNGVDYPFVSVTKNDELLESAVGIHFEDAYFGGVDREFFNNDRIDIRFEMPVVLRRQDKRIKGCGGMAALTRGPLVYCLESTDNAEDIFSTEIDADSFQTRFDPQLLGGTTIITCRSGNGKRYTWIPYLLWGNRGESRMTVFIKVTQSA